MPQVYVAEMHGSTLLYTCTYISNCQVGIAADLASARGYRFTTSSTNAILHSAFLQLNVHSCTSTYEVSSQTGQLLFLTSVYHI